MEHLTTRPTLDLASHLFKFYSKDNNGNSNNNIDIKDINDNKDNKDNKLNILLPAPPRAWLHISSFTTRGKDNQKDNSGKSRNDDNTPWPRTTVCLNSYYNKVE